MMKSNRRDFLKTTALAGLAAPLSAKAAEGGSAKRGYYSSLPSLGEFDVVVFGAGPGGIGAAIRAARTGCKVALVEKYGFAGGVGIYGCTPLFYLFEHRGPGGWGGPRKEWRQIIRGLADETVRRLDRVGAAYPMANGDCNVPLKKKIGNDPLLGKVMFPVDTLCALYHEMLSEAGVHKLFYTHLCDALTDGRCVTGAVVSCIEGLRTLKAKVFVDATGEATFANLAGCRTETPNPMGTMHKSIFMFLGGLRKGAIGNYTKAYNRLRKSGVLPKNIWAGPGYSELPNEGEIILPIAYANGDSSRSAEMTRMDEELRHLNLKILDVLQREVPGFENAHSIRQAIQVGVRDGRHIVGRAKVDVDFLNLGSVPNDGVVPIWRWWGGEHSPDQSKGFGTSTRGYKPTLTSIPYGALVSADLDNLFAAGRSIAVDPYAVTTIRMMPTCMAIGEAAGTAAAIMCEKDIRDAGAVPYAVLADRLVAANGILK